MAQGTGLMNTAPSPIPGGGTNPTGGRIGVTAPNSSTALTTPPPLGAIPTSYTPQVAASGTPSSFAGNGYSASNPMQGLSSGTNFSADQMGKDPNLWGDLGRELTDAYGRGTGMMLFNMITKGMFNPDVANALINAMQPMRTRGLNDLQGSFGSAGARFSSAAAIGMGDFESQFAANEQSTLANLFLKDQALQTSLLENAMPTLHGENVNRAGHSTLGMILQALGPAAAMIPGAGPFIAAAMETVGKGMNKGGGGGGGSVGAGLQSSISDIMNMISPKSGVSSTDMPASTPSASADAWREIVMSSSAGNQLGGADMSNGGSFDEQGIVPFLN